MEQEAFRAHRTAVGDAGDADGEHKHVEIFPQHWETKVASKPFGRVHQVETVDSGAGNRQRQRVGAGGDGGSSGTSGYRRPQRSSSPGCAEVCKDVAPVGPDDDADRGRDVAVVAVEVVVGR